jgi:hypothetical protein
MIARRASSLLAVLAAFGLGCASPQTEILLVVGADLAVPGEIDRLRIRAFGAETDGGFDRTYDLTAPESRLPITLLLVSAGGRAGPLHVNLLASKGGADVVERSASTMFVEGKVLVLHLDLARSCAGLTACAGANETCVAGSCVPDEISGGSLPPYAGPWSIGDGGVGSPSSDPRSDASAPDGGGGRDVGSESAGAALPGLPNGEACRGGSACLSGYCVDGVCCETACTKSCHSCRIAAAPGKCGSVAVGAADPRGLCADQGAASCGTTGLCDGVGACQRFSAATICAAERCEANGYVPAATCASGKCTTPSRTDCSPGSCHVGGCVAPPSITIGATQDTLFQGYDGPEATKFRDACPNGSFVIGYEASIGNEASVGNQVVAQLQTRCGVPSVAQDGSTILVAPGSSLILRGGVSAPLAASDCPKNEVVVGFDGRSAALLDQLSVRCAPLSISGRTVMIGSPTNLAPVGGNGGNPFARTDCGPGMAAVGTNVALRNWVSGFGLVCAPLGVQ